ncbi:MAG: hypothetical protein FJX76_22245, partial [Armatimonadetes bacterium]|nr:hypothetical protein [Armatimonadota bacterium]
MVALTLGGALLAEVSFPLAWACEALMSSGGLILALRFVEPPRARSEITAPPARVPWGIDFPGTAVAASASVVGLLCTGALSAGGGAPLASGLLVAGLMAMEAAGALLAGRAPGLRRIAAAAAVVLCVTAAQPAVMGMAAAGDGGGRAVPAGRRDAP